MKLHISAERIFETPSDGHYFFGYYDKPQLSKDDKRLLVLKTDFLDHILDKNDLISIGHFDLDQKNASFVEVGKTRAANWQQGCMLQWLGPDYNEWIIYNDLVDNKFVAILQNVFSGERKQISKAIYSVCPHGENAICVDFERHYWCRRGYAYDGIYNKDKNKSVVKADGIWLLNLKTDTVRKIVAIEDLIATKHLTNMQGAIHYVEHLMFNPSGKRFCFLHRWKMLDGGVYARLYTVNVDGSDLYLLNDSGRMSHYCWQDDNHLLVYGGLTNQLNSLRKDKNVIKYFFKPLLPLYHKVVKNNTPLFKYLAGDSYIILRDQSSSARRVAPALSLRDGHPSFNKKSQSIFITDTYSDPADTEKAKLILFDLKSNRHYVLDEFDSIPVYDNGPLRCDLHPRWSISGEYISVDTMDSKRRSVYLYKLHTSL
jgi:hypothetical protein